MLSSTASAAALTFDELREEDEAVAAGSGADLSLSLRRKDDQLSSVKNRTAGGWFASIWRYRVWSGKDGCGVAAKRLRSSKLTQSRLDGRSKSVLTFHAGADRGRPTTSTLHTSPPAALSTGSYPIPQPMP